jgi:hypothetical protein
MTIEERLENMEQELGRVKRRNHKLLGAILVLLGGLVAAGVFKTTVTPAQAQGVGTAQEIRAKSIVLEDESGKPRAVLGADKDGPRLELRDENGKNCAVLSALKDGPALGLYDEKGVRRAGMAVGKDGPMLELWDEKGQYRFAAGKTKTVSPDGKTIEYPESSLILFGPDGKVIWSAIH